MCRRPGSERADRRRLAGAVPRPPGESVERSSLNAINVEPAVAVEVDQAHPSRHRLGEQVLLGVAAIELKAEAGRLGVVDEIRRGLLRFGIRALTTPGRSRLGFAVPSRAWPKVREALTEHRPGLCHFARRQVA